MTTTNTPIPARFRAMQDPDDARDLAQDYLADQEAQYDDYVTECIEAGVKPKPFVARLVKR